jgi:hypothetical protein
MARKLLFSNEQGNASLFLIPTSAAQKQRERHELSVASQQGERRIQMTLMKKLVLPAVAGILMLGGLVGCEREGPMERAGEKIDETAEKAGDKVEKATDR